MSRAPLWLQLLIVTLGAARLTALVTGDRIARSVRWPLIKRWGEDSYPGTLLSCPWCAGWWVSLACVIAWAFWPEVTTAVLLPWAVAFVVGALGAKLGPTDDPEEERPEPPAPVWPEVVVRTSDEDRGGIRFTPPGIRPRGDAT